MPQSLRPSAALPLAALALAATLVVGAPVRAETRPPAQGPLCSASVLTALTAWDTGLAAAAKLGDKAVAVAREKGRDYLLPLLGIDPRSAAPQQDGNVGTLEGLLESSRQDPARRQELCIALTQAVEDARTQAGAGLDALRRALDGLQRSEPKPSPHPPTTPPPAGKDDLIRI